MMMLGSVAMNPTAATVIFPRHTGEIDETDREIEATIAKGDGMTAELTTVTADLDLRGDRDLPNRDIADPGDHTMAIATYRADEMSPNVDEMG